MKYSEERSFGINALFFILSIASIFIIPVIITIILRNYTNNYYVLELTSNGLLIIFLFSLYFKDLKREAKIYFSEFGKNFSKSIKYYIVGIIAMIIFNLLISIIVNKGVSDNENLVREMLFKSPVFTMLSIIIVAPLSEELIFRKSLQPLVKNKWIYATLCGLLFGGAHLLAGEFVISDLLYLLPYGSLGFVFALMDYETKSTWTSIIIHALHNGATGVLLLIVYYVGAL